MTRSAGGPGILLGVIGRPHGVRGHVHVTSYTERPADFFSYGPLKDERGRRFSLIARGEGVSEMSVDGASIRDRDAAARLTNTRLYVDRVALPPAEEDEFYLADLIGLLAMDGAGAALGTVIAVHDYGGGPSLEIAREGAPSMLVAFTRATVPVVNIALRRVVVAMPDEVLVAEDAREAAE